MNQYIGLDVSLKDTAISIREDGKRIWRGKCPSDPKLLAEMIRKNAPRARRVVFETGPLSTWFYHALTSEGVPAICIEARHAQKVLDETLNKTDANDADGLAQLAEAGFYKVVRVKSLDAMMARTLVAAREQLLNISTQLGNQIRGLVKTFGLIIPKGKGRVFDGDVRKLLDGNNELAKIIFASFGGVARYPQARSRSWSPVADGGTWERSYEAIDDNPRHRRYHGGILRYGN